MSKGKVVRSAGVILVAMIIARIIGLVRDQTIAIQFGQNYLTDAYQASFIIPDLLYNLLAGGALGAALVPVLTKYFEEDPREGFKIASTFFNIISLFTLVLVVLGIIFSPQIMSYLVSGFSPQTLDLTIRLTRIILPIILFIALSGASMGVLNSLNHFATPAYASILFNLGIVLAAIFLGPRIGIFSLAYGAVFGALAMTIVQLPVLIKKGFRYRPLLYLDSPGFRRIIRLWLPAAIVLSVSQFNFAVIIFLASGFAEGSVSALRYANRVMLLPFTTFAVAFTTAIFPTLSIQSKKNLEEFKDTLSFGIRLSFFYALPAAVGLFVLRVPVIRLLFQHGKFGPQETEITAYALMFYTIGILGHSVALVLKRAYFALESRGTPLAIGFIVMALNLVLGISLMKYSGLSYGGLALATSLAASAEMIFLFGTIRKRLSPLPFLPILVCFLKISFASIVMGISLVLVQPATNKLFLSSALVSSLIKLGLMIILGIIIFTFMATVLRVAEVQTVWDRLSGRFGKKPV